MTLCVYRGKGRQPWRWRLIAKNGKIVADSAEGYSTRAGVWKAVQRLQTSLNSRPVVVTARA